MSAPRTGTALPAIDGITPEGVEAKTATAKVWCPPSTHRDHGDRVYVLMECHVADVAHPEIIEDGLRVGVVRQEKLKADGAWLLGDIEGQALSKVAMRRKRLHETGGQTELPDTALRDEVRDGLTHLLDEVSVLFTAAPDDLSVFMPPEDEDDEGGSDA